MNKKVYLITLVLVLVIISTIFLLLNLPEKSKPEWTWRNASVIKSEEECVSYGGKWYSWSFWQAGKKACDMPYPDGGKICDDSSDCESRLCLYTKENPIVNQSSAGECAQWISTSCVNHNYFIENGKIVEEICVE